MATLEAQADATTEQNENDAVEAMKQHFLDNSTIRSNGVREVSKAGFSAALLSQGVSGEHVKKVQTVLDNATTAAAMIAADDLEGKIGETSKENLANDDHRRGLSSMVRLPTPGGKTEVEVKAEKVSPVPFRGNADGSGERSSVIRVSVNGTGRINKDLPESLSTRMKAALGIDE